MEKSTIFSKEGHSSPSLNLQPEIERLLKRQKASVSTLRRDFYNALAEKLGDKLQNNLDEKVKIYQNKDIQNAFVFNLLIGESTIPSSKLIQCVVDASGKIRLRFYTNRSDTGLSPEWDLVYDTILSNNGFETLAWTYRKALTPKMLFRCIGSIVKFGDYYI